MTEHDTGSDREDSPPPPEQALLIDALERPLAPEEARRLREAIARDPSLAQDQALLAQLQALRLETRIARHEEAAWQAFVSQLEAVPRPRPALRQARWRALLEAFRPALPALAAALILTQTGALFWLTQHQEEPGGSRGGAVASCPALLIRPAPGARLDDLGRVLLQAGGRISDGPDAAGRYRLQGPPAFHDTAAGLLAGLADEVVPAPDCVKK